MVPFQVVISENLLGIFTAAGSNPVASLSRITKRVQTICQQLVLVHRTGKKAGNHRGQKHPTLFITHQKFYRLFHVLLLVFLIIRIAAAVQV